MKKPLFAIKDTIAARLLTRVFYYYILVTITVTVIHMVADFRTTQSDTEMDLAVFQGSFQPGLAIALWNQEDLGLELSLAAMLQVPQIVGAKVLDGEGKQVGAIGEVLDDQGKSIVYVENKPLITKDVATFNRLFWNKEDIYYSDDSVYHVGSLILYSSSGFVFTRVQEGYLFIIVNSIIKTIALWGIVLLLSKPMVTKPLQEFSAALQDRNVSNLKKFRFDTVGIKSIELIALETAFNELLEKLTSAIHKIKFSEDLIKDLNSGLEIKIRERTQQLQQSNRDLQDSMVEIKLSQKRLFDSEKMASIGRLVAGVAHEVNTPIGISITATSLLNEHLAKFKAEFKEGTISKSGAQKFLIECQEATDISLINLKRAAHLIKTFKNVAVDQGGDRLEEFNIYQNIQGAIMATSPRFQEGRHQVELIGAEQVKIKSYPGSLLQVMTSLLINSLIHGFKDRPNGLVTIEFYTEQQQVIIHYRDDGRGLSKEEKQNVFEPFYTTERSKGGTGLGGHITYNLVTQRMQGSIRCDNNPGGGASFTISLPLTVQEDVSSNNIQVN